MYHISGWHKTKITFIHFSSLSTSSGAGSSSGATCETAAQADKTHSGERIRRIYSTAVKISEVNEPLPTPCSGWYSISQKRKTGKQTQQTSPAAGPDCSTGILQGSSSCDGCLVPGNASLLLSNLCWISSEPCPGGCLAPAHTFGAPAHTFGYRQVQSLLAYMMLICWPQLQSIKLLHKQEKTLSGFTSRQ